MPTAVMVGPKEVFLTSVYLPNEDSISLTFTNWPLRDDILEGIKKQYKEKAKPFEAVVKKAIFPKHRMGRVECNGVVIERICLIDNDHRGSDYHVPVNINDRFAGRRRRYDSGQ